MIYAKLFGGPLDGMTEPVSEQCTGLKLRHPRYTYALAEGETQTEHWYRKSPDDPAYFIYEGPAE